MIYLRRLWRRAKATDNFQAGGGSNTSIGPVKVGNNNNNHGTSGSSSGGKPSSTSSSNSQCSTNADCPSGEYCTRSSNLASGLSCQSGQGQAPTAQPQQPQSPSPAVTNLAPLSSNGTHRVGSLIPNYIVKCSSNNDCGGGSICISGQCEITNCDSGDCTVPPGGQCTTDFQCQQIATLHYVQQCKKQLTGGPSGICAPAIGWCRDNADCGAGSNRICDQNRCRLINPQCTTNSDCSSGNVCISDLCQVGERNVGGQCTSHGDCTRPSTVIVVVLLISYHLLLLLLLLRI